MGSDVHSSCHRCGRMGHLARDCTIKTCFRCNGRGHMAWECTVGVACSACGETGHLQRNCRNVACHRCGRKGHISKFCTDPFARAAEIERMERQQAVLAARTAQMERWSAQRGTVRQPGKGRGGTGATPSAWEGLGSSLTRTPPVFVLKSASGSKSAPPTAKGSLRSGSSGSGRKEAPGRGGEGVSGGRKRSLQQSTGPDGDRAKTKHEKLEGMASEAAAGAPAPGATSAAVGGEGGGEGGVDRSAGALTGLLGYGSEDDEDEDEGDGRGKSPRANVEEDISHRSRAIPQYPEEAGLEARADGSPCSDMLASEAEMCRTGSRGGGAALLALSEASDQDPGAEMPGACTVQAPCNSAGCTVGEEQEGTEGEERKPVCRHECDATLVPESPDNGPDKLQGLGPVGAKGVVVAAGDECGGVRKQPPNQEGQGFSALASMEKHHSATESRDTGLVQHLNVVDGRA